MSNLIEDESSRFCRQEKKTPLHLLSRWDAVMTERSEHRGQHEIKMEEILILEVTQILNYLADLGLDGDFNRESSE